MRRLVFGLIVLPLSLKGQAAPAQDRAFEFPDTLGANFAISDSATARGKPTDYDFLEGSWRFRFQQRRRDGSWNPPFSGHWRSSKMAGGRIVEDHWRPDNANLPASGGTFTWRAFDDASGRWFMMGIGTDAAKWRPGVTWSDESSRYVVQHYDSTTMRIRYFDITPNRFLWRADVTYDRGATWVRDWWIMEVRRIGK